MKKKKEGERENLMMIEGRRREGERIWEMEDRRSEVAAPERGG